MLYVNFCVNMNVRVACPNDFCPRFLQNMLIDSVNEF